jgi:hypothetical protein
MNAGIAVGDLVKFAMPPEWSERIEEWINVEKTCTRCGYKYFEISNMGARKCKQHSGYYMYHSKKWSCCGKDIPGRYYGCVRADHTILLREYNESDSEKVPKAISKVLGLREKSFESDPGVIADLHGIQKYTVDGAAEVENTMTEYTYVSRYDRIEANKLM